MLQSANATSRWLFLWWLATSRNSGKLHIFHHQTYIHTSMQAAAMNNYVVWKLASVYCPKLAYIATQQQSQLFLLLINKHNCWQYSPIAADTAMSADRVTMIPSFIFPCLWAGHRQQLTDSLLILAFSRYTLQLSDWRSYLFLNLKAKYPYKDPLCIALVFSRPARRARAWPGARHFRWSLDRISLTFNIMIAQKNPPLQITAVEAQRS